MKGAAVDVATVRVDYPLRSGLRLLWKGATEPGSFKRALDDVSFRIGEGERVALIGPNGAGKSTLLRVIAGILPPAAGSVRVSGAVAPLFEFATGFEMERSGLENIKIRGLLQGLSWREISAKLDEIAIFSELGDALVQPVRTYSTGMFVRLAFSTATAIEPDILLIDEAFGAGDQHFSHKASARMRSLMQRGRVLVFTSHNMGLVRELCSRAIWLDSGRIRADGPVEQVVTKYVQAETATP